jgi:hypothetical protein
MGKFDVGFGFGTVWFSCYLGMGLKEAEKLQLGTALGLFWVVCGL